MIESVVWKDFNTKYGKAIARAWTDADYKAKLLEDPRAALAEVGIEVPAGVDIEIAEVDTEHVQLVLPPAPEGGITDESLQTAIGGFCAPGISCWSVPPGWSCMSSK